MIRYLLNSDDGNWYKTLYKNFNEYNYSNDFFKIIYECETWGIVEEKDSFSSKPKYHLVIK